MVTTGDPTAIGLGDVAPFFWVLRRAKGETWDTGPGMGQKPMKLPHDWGNTQPLTS